MSLWQFKKKKKEIVFSHHPFKQENKSFIQNIYQFMGNSNSAEKFIVKLHETMANLVRNGCELLDLEKAANATAELIKADGDKKTDVNPKTLIRSFVDPFTKLNLLHLICYGDYIFLRDPSKDKKRLELLKEIVVDNKICEDVNCVDPASGRNALHFACARPLPHPGDFGDSNTELVRFLLSEGVSFDRRDKNGLTPLILAADRMYLGSIKELVGRGARVDAIDSLGLNVFHHFVLAYGNRSCHSSIPLNDLISTLETMTAVSLSQAKNLAVLGFANPGGAAIRAYYDGKENVSRQGENRVKPVEEFQYIKNNSLPFTPLLIAISCFILEDAEATMLKPGRAAIVSHLIRNGFSFYEPASFYHAFGRNCPFSAKDPTGDSMQSLITQDGGTTSNPEAKFDFALHRQGIAAFLARLHVDDATILQQDNYSKLPSVLQFPRGVLLTTSRNFAPQIFADDADRDALARANPLIASIVLTHFGIFSYLVREGGFPVLLNPVGPRGVTPLHVLLGIRMDDLAHEPVHKYFVDRCLEFAFKLAAEEKYFELNPNFDLALLVAVDASDQDKKFSPVYRTRADLAKFAVTLAAFFASPGSAVLPTRDSFKLSPLVSALANLRPVTLANLIPQCAQLQSAFFKSQCRQLVQRVFISSGETPGTLKRLLADGGIFPNATQLQIQGASNTTSSDIEWIAGDESVKFTSLEFVECAVDLHVIASSRKLKESLERLALIRCQQQGIVNKDLEELARVRWSKEVKLVVEGGGNEMKANVVAANNARVGVAGPPFRCVYYPDLAKPGLD